MTDILGYDVDGRPLRVGDRCVIAAEFAIHPVDRHHIGVEFIVTGPGVRSGSVKTDVPDDEGGSYDAKAKFIRRLQDRPETVTWESMRDIWQPDEVTA